MTRVEYVAIREKLTTMHANHGGDIAEVAYMYALCREVFRYVDSLVTPEECKERCSEVFMVAPALDCDDFDAWYARQYEQTR